jgi:hypothetical protein
MAEGVAAQGEFGKAGNVRIPRAAIDPNFTNSHEFQNLY